MRFDRSILNLALDPVTNFGKVTVSTGYTSTDTTPIILVSGDGSKLPNPTTDGEFNLIWWNWSIYPDPSDDPNVEIVRVIARSGDALSITRGQENTTPSNKNNLGRTYKMILSQTKKTIGDIQTDAQSRVDNHSLLSTGIHGVGLDTIDGITARNNAIATHASMTSSIHNFDVSGNAPPQLHGATSHDITTVDQGAALSSVTQIPAHGSVQHTGTIGTWGQIDKAISNISDIATKSHSSLTDIGANTHPQIDTHISSYTNIHGISAGLDADKPAIPTVGQRYIAVDTQKDYECYIAGTWRDVTTTHSSRTASVHNFDASGNAPPQLHGLASHTGIVGDHQGNLTSIGTNTHTQIDTHIGSTSSVHNFDASGNAPSQIHGKLKHDATTVDGGAALSLVTQIPMHGTAQHTGTIGTWVQIDKTTSSIADIATRSHSSLTDGAIPGTTNSHAAIDTAISNSSSHIAATTGIHGTTGNLVATGAAVSGQYNSAKYTTTISLDWNHGNVQYIQLASGGQTFTFANPRDGGRYMIILKQPSSGGAGTVTWPGTVLWSGATSPTLTTTNNKVDIVTFVYDATNGYYYGGTSLNY